MLTGMQARSIGIVGASRRSHLIQQACIQFKKLWAAARSVALMLPESMTFGKGLKLLLLVLMGRKLNAH